MQARVMRTIGKGMGIAAFMVCAASGCVELKYTAVDRLDDKIAILTSRAPRSVYVAVPSVRHKDRRHIEFFASSVAAVLEKNGFTVVADPAAADIVIHANARFYRKAHGTFLFILILPIYRFNDDFDGIAMDLSYKTDQGQWRKNYRVYYRGWLADDFERAIALLCKAIIADLPAAPQK
jgi:hypothetical protein